MVIFHCYVSLPEGIVILKDESRLTAVRSNVQSAKGIIASPKKWKSTSLPFLRALV